MRRRTAAVVLTAAVLSGCGSGQQLEALRSQPLADLSRTPVADDVQEVSRTETDAGTALGKPVRARVTVVYTVSGDPTSTFQEVRQVAVEDGWALQDPVETVSGTTVRGDKRLDGEQGLLGLTFVPAGSTGASGVEGPAVVTVLAVSDEPAA